MSTRDEDGRMSRSEFAYTWLLPAIFEQSPLPIVV